jgi:hypothetical protein
MSWREVPNRFANEPAMTFHADICKWVKTTTAKYTPHFLLSFQMCEDGCQCLIRIWIFVEIFLKITNHYSHYILFLDKVTAFVPLS